MSVDDDEAPESEASPPTAAAAASSVSRAAATSWLTCDDEEDEALFAAMARTVKHRRKDTGESKCRVSGVQDQKHDGETRRATIKQTN